ncbi:MAG TPA: DHH family phosphoesterase [Prolixibacteraceae bacterium]|nr:DHH family phosphoesterase [Prolixibacteraceae bacterium]
MKNTDIEVIAQVKELLTNQKCKIAIVPHENPDGDAIGSAIGFAEVLAEFGHQVNIISPTEYPDFLKWFSSELKILVYSTDKKAAEEVLKQSDVLICVDFNEAKRAGKLEKSILKFANPKILVDHHPYPSDFCNYTISETGYSSTAELIFDVLNSIGLGGFFSKKSAEALYTGILTDTGSFSHGTSNPNTFQVVSELMKFDIAVEKIQSGVYHNFSADRMKLLGYCLNNKMVVYPELRTALISISKQELLDYNFKTGDTEGFVNFPLSIANIVFSTIFIEKDGIIKASFRSKGNFHVNHIARDHFNGGGHRNAAGGEIKLTLNEAIQKFTQLLPDYKHQLLETEI